MKSARATSISAGNKETEDEDHLEQAQASLESLREALEADEFESATTFLAGPTNKVKRERWRRVQFSGTLAKRYRSAVIRSLSDNLPTDENLVLFTYDETFFSQTPVLVKADFPDLADWLDETPTADFNRTFDGNADFLSEVKLHVVSLTNVEGTKNLTIYKRRSGAQLVKRQGYLASFTGSKNEFEIVKSPIYDFPVDADFFEWDGFLYVGNINALEFTTNIREITQNQAKKALQAIKAIPGLSVQGLEMVEQSLLERPRLSKRLANAAKNRTFGELKASAVKQHIKMYALSLKTRVHDNKLEISFDTSNRVHVEEFVNLVSDVYLKSLLTDYDYKSHSKQRLKKASS